MVWVDHDEPETGEGSGTFDTLVCERAALQ